MNGIKFVKKELMKTLEDKITIATPQVNLIPNFSPIETPNGIPLFIANIVKG